MICKNCGKEVAEGQSICLSCGCKIEQFAKLTLKWPIENNKIGKKMKIYITVVGENYNQEHLMRYGKEITVTLPYGRYSLVCVCGVQAFPVGISLLADATYQVFAKSIWSRITLTRV